MDRDQHITQDAAEHYAVFLLADTAEKRGWNLYPSSQRLKESLDDYLSFRGWDFDTDFSHKYPAYKRNVDLQIPVFLDRLHSFFPGARFGFEIDEAAYRKMGLKADFSIEVSGLENPFLVSLKNYVGSGGVMRPQVSSGTFLSFAAGFIFSRVGVGTYSDPRNLSEQFRGSNREARNAVLEHMNQQSLIRPLEVLEELQQIVRTDLLQLRMYDKNKIREVIEHIVPRAQQAMLAIFEELGEEIVRQRFLERVGLDGTDEILYFDATNSVDSITSSRFGELCKSVNNPSTRFSFAPAGQSLRFQFSRNQDLILKVDVPLTVNTNGAWFRPKEKYSGTQTKNDKGNLVELQWGEIRPFKSREIATSTNTYVNLAATGIFD